MLLKYSFTVELLLFIKRHSVGLRFITIQVFTNNYSNGGSDSERGVSFLETISFGNFIVQSTHDIDEGFTLGECIFFG